MTTLDASGAFDALLAKLGEPSGEYRNPAVFDGHLRIYLTLHCNLRCPYCVNEQVGPHDKAYPVRPPRDWRDAINREQRHVVFTGGEPFLYPGLAELVNGIEPGLKVRVYTNFSLDATPVLAAVTRPVHLYVSWHPQRRVDRGVFLANLRAMQGNPLFTADLHAIDARESRAGLAADLAFFADQGFTVRMDDDQRAFEGAGQATRRMAACSKTIYLIAPDGTRYQCVSRLVRRDSPMENLFDGPLGLASAVSLCPDYGNCSPCDALGETRMVLA
ncbi:MAG: radical SAM protein [Pseudodesulfovibrio sp.]